MNPTSGDHRPSTASRDPEFGPPDPALYAPLTLRELDVLHAHLSSGWHKQMAVYEPLSGLWREVSELLTDSHTAHGIAMAADETGGVL